MNDNISKQDLEVLKKCEGLYNFEMLCNKY